MLPEVISENDCLFDILLPADIHAEASLRFARRLASYTWMEYYFPSYE
jgi:hypothetical protein